MIFIDISKFNPNGTWTNNALKHTTAIAGSANRSTYLKLPKNHIWGDLKDDLAALYKRKCWITEEFVTEYGCMEHFRPKGRVEFVKDTKNAKTNKQKVLTLIQKVLPTFQELEQPHGGYWWLAYDYSNYLFANQVVNTTHKQNFFPLRNTSFQASSSTDNHHMEETFLLNPTNPNDPKLLDFNYLGEAQPLYTARAAQDANKVWEFERAAVSIVIYGLNEKDGLINSRRARWTACEQKIKKADKKLSTYIHNRKDIHAARDFAELVAEIKELIHEKSDFSAVAKACLRVNRKQWMIDYGIIH
jgi:hypothetical protein